MYRLNVQATQQEHQSHQQQQSSPSHIKTAATITSNIVLQKSTATAIPRKKLQARTSTNTDVDSTTIGVSDGAAADLTLPHLIRICGTRSVVAAATSSPTTNIHTININTDPVVSRLQIREEESMTSDINNELLSEQQQSAFLRHDGNEMDKISVVRANSTTTNTNVVMAATIEDKLKYLAALKTEPILNEVMHTSTTTTTQIPTLGLTPTTPTTHFKKRHSKTEALGIAIGGVGANSLQNTKYLENMAADLTISKGTTTTASSTDTSNSSTLTTTILGGESMSNTINVSLESKPVYASNIVVVSGDSLDGVSNGACLLAYEATKRPRLDSPKHWLPISSPGSGAASSSVPPLSPSPVSQSQSITANMANEYASPLSAGSYDAFSPGGKTGK